MLKYVDVKETFSEVPDEISLCISLSGCRIRCKDCHSKYLWEFVGDELTPKVLKDLIDKHSGISCVCLFGGEHDINGLMNLFRIVKHEYNLKTCWYTGLESISLNDCPILFPFLDYVKYGPYIKERGGLDCETTNQKFLMRTKDGWDNITYKFQKL